MISFGEYSIGDWKQSSKYRHERPVYKQDTLCLYIIIVQQCYDNENLHALYFNNYGVHGGVYSPNTKDMYYFYDRIRLFYGLDISNYDISLPSLEDSKAMVDNFLSKFNKLKILI